MNILTWFWPQKIARIKSEFNTEIVVVEFMGKKYIDVGGLMQSGSFLERIFKKGFQKLKISKLINPKKILILGLGGGSIVKVINDLFSEVEITGVEIDKKMIDVAKKYLSLNKYKNLKIIIADAFKIVKLQNHKYDLIFVDLYKGYEINKKAGSDDFLINLKRILNKNGYIVFNRIYFQKYIFEANLFLDKLKKVFQYINTAKIYSNILVLVK